MSSSCIQEVWEQTGGKEATVNTLLDLLQEQELKEEVPGAPVLPEPPVLPGAPELSDSETAKDKRNGLWD